MVYCYTGHTGQVAATLLRAFGYDAVNLKFGMMGWTDNDEVLATVRVCCRWWLSDGDRGDGR